MKKVLFTFCFLLFAANNSWGQISFAAYFDGYWSSWVPADAKIKGDYDGFIIYSESEGPWNYRFKFIVDNFKIPNKKQRKKDIKKGNFYTFTGTVEYYVSFSHPSALSIFRESRNATFCPAVLSSGLPAKKITSKATIKVAPFKKLPKVYNIWYDNVAIAIDLGTTYFPGKVFL